MTKQQRLDGKGKLVRLTAAMEKDIRAFCMRWGIKSENELVRNAIAAYIYADHSKGRILPQGSEDLCRKIDVLQNTLDRIFKTE